MLKVPGVQVLGGTENSLPPPTERGYDTQTERREQPYQHSGKSASAGDCNSKEPSGHWCQPSGHPSGVLKSRVGVGAQPELRENPSSSGSQNNKEDSYHGEWETFLA